MIKLRLLAWTGYRQMLQPHLGELRRRQIELEVVEQPDADEIYRRFAADRRSFDLVIVDWEYRHEYEKLLTAIPEKFIRPGNFSEPFKARYLERREGEILFVPIRFGTNGMVYRLTDGGTEHKPFQWTLSERFDYEAQRDKQVGIWSWWLPNMLLLARGAGMRSPHEFLARQLAKDPAWRGITDRFVGAVRGPRQRKPYLFPSLADIVRYELEEPSESRHIEWILGPSEMIVAPITVKLRQQRRDPTISWDIPSLGGLVWVETVAVSKHLRQSSVRLEAALDFMFFLQSAEVQSSLISGGEFRAHEISHLRRSYSHWSYSASNASVVDSMEPEIKAAFDNNALESSERFNGWIDENVRNGHLMLRKLPEDPDAWEKLWEDLLDRCQAA